MNKEKFITQNVLEFTTSKNDKEVFVVVPGTTNAYTLCYPCGEKYLFKRENQLVGFAKFLKSFASKVKNSISKLDKNGGIVHETYTATYSNRGESEIKATLEGQPAGDVKVSLHGNSRITSAEELKQFADALLELVKKNNKGRK